MGDRFSPARAWFRLRGRSPGTPGPLGLLEDGEWHTVEPILGAAAFDSRARLADGTLTGAGLAELAGRLSRATRLPEKPAFGLPVPCPGKVLCLGKNYRAHAAELASEPPRDPLFFNKLPQCLLPDGGSVRLPPGVGRVDHEGELCLVLGADGTTVAGLTLFDDVTARDLQAADRDRGYPWLRSKSFDTFGPVGPWVVPFSDVFDGPPPADLTPDLALETLVNGEVRQSSRTGRMVHRVAATLAWISRHTTLRPGDLVATGTPAGVSPLAAGDRVEVRCDRIGSLRHGVV